MRCCQCKRLLQSTERGFEADGNLYCQATVMSGAVADPYGSNALTLMGAMRLPLWERCADPCESDVLTLMGAMRLPLWERCAYPYGSDALTLMGAMR